MFLESSVRDVEMTPVMTSVPVKFAAAFSERPAISRFDCMSVHPALVSLRVCDLIRQLDRHKSFSDGVISSTTQTHSYSAHTLHILHPSFTPKCTHCYFSHRCVCRCVVVFYVF